MGKQTTRSSRVKLIHLLTCVNSVRRKVVDSSEIIRKYEYMNQ